MSSIERYPAQGRPEICYLHLLGNASFGRLFVREIFSTFVASQRKNRFGHSESVFRSSLIENLTVFNKQKENEQRSSCVCISGALYHLAYRRCGALLIVYFCLGFVRTFYQINDRLHTFLYDHLRISAFLPLRQFIKPEQNIIKFINMKKFSTLCLLAIVALCGLTACNEDPEAINNAPEVFVDEATDLMRTSAVLTGRILAPANAKITEYGFKISSTSDFTSADTDVYRFYSEEGLANFSTQITDLEINGTYFYVAYATNGLEEMTSTLKTFTTPQRSGVLFSDLKLIDASTATFSARISDTGGSEIYDVGFCWSTNEYPTTYDEMMSTTLNDDGSFTAALSDMKAGVTYYLRAFANSDVLGNGATLTTSYSQEMLEICIEEKEAPKIKPTVEAKPISATATSLTFEVTSGNAEQVNWLIFSELEQTIHGEITAEKVLGNENKIEPNRTIEITADALTPETTYLIYAAALNQHAMVLSEPIEMSTSQATAVTLKPNKYTSSTLTFTVATTNTDKATWVILSPSEVISHGSVTAEKVLSSNNYIETNKEVSVIVEHLDPATTYTIYAAAEKEGVKVLSQKLEMTTDIESSATLAPLNVELGVVGHHTDWSSDSVMRWDGTLYVAKNIALEAGKEFKVRKAGIWDDNYNWGPIADTEIAVGDSVNVVCGSASQNILIPASGTYDVYFDYAGLKVWLMTAGADAPKAETPVIPDQPSDGTKVTLGVVGDHTGWTLDNIMTFEDDFYVAYNVAMEAGKGFKIRKAGVWDDNYNWGPSFITEIAVNGSLNVVNGAGSQNILVPATGTYDIYFDKKALTVWLMEIGLKPGEKDKEDIDPESTKIYYTSLDGQIIEPYSSNGFGSKIISNTYTDGQGVILFDGKVTSIGSSAFINRINLRSITIPDSVTSIGNSAFSGCDGLSSVIIPDNVTSIGNSTFKGCSRLANVTIGNGTTSIGAEAFRNCSGLTNVIIGNGTTSIGKWAFVDCTSLASVTIGSGVTSIGYEAFLDCSNMNAVYISDVAAWCKIAFEDYVSNPLYYAKNLYLNGELQTDLTIPSDVTEIKSYTFYRCTSLTSVTIPDSVISIGERAFSTCSGLTSVTIPDSVTEIGKTAFHSCKGLTSVSIGKGTSSIGEYAFGFCTGLTSIIIPDNVTKIGTGAFYKSTGLTNVTIGNGVTIIGESAFYGCTGLINITIPDNVISIGNQAFYECSGLTSVSIGNGLYSIGKNAYSNCTNLTAVYCKPTTPPAGWETMFDKNASDRKIYVPNASLDAYKTAYGWNVYADAIVGYDFSE